MSPASAGVAAVADAAADQPSPSSAATPHRSTRGASKQRRDQINVEISRMRDLLPLSDSIKDRLFQLQVMSLACIFIRKHRYRTHIITSVENTEASTSTSPPPTLSKSLDASKTLRGFLFMTTKSGKILYISENASEYLGHSVEEIMCQGDSLYDMVDSRDHVALQSLLGAGPPEKDNFPDDKIFLCRMNLSRTAKRQLQFHKFVLFHGRFVHPAEYHSSPSNLSTHSIQPVFAAFCQPLLNPENAELLAAGNTDAFSSQHYMDMKFRDMDNIFIERLGYTRCELLDMSWYNLVHPDHLADLAYKHRLLTEEKEGSVLALVRMQCKSGEWLWLHCVMSIRSTGSSENEARRQRHTIFMAHQIVGESEANALRANGWIYSMRHSYPTSFTSQDSPESLPHDRPCSPTSPFGLENQLNMMFKFQPIPMQLIKQEPPCFPAFPPHLQHPALFQMHCPQIKVEIPVKQTPPLCLITPDHSSPESASSYTAANYCEIKKELELDGNRNLLDGVTELIRAVDRNALPELRDLEEFFKQEEYATSSTDSQPSPQSSHSSFPPPPQTPVLPSPQFPTKLPSLEGCLPFAYPPTYPGAFSSPHPFDPTFYPNHRRRIGSWTGM